MLNVYLRGSQDRLERAADPLAALKSGTAIWVDLVKATEAEEAMVEAALHVDAPTKEERNALEDSSRFWRDDHQVQAAATLVALEKNDRLRADSVTFILSGPTLLTVRDIEPKAFIIGEGRASANVGKAQSGADAFMALLDAISERTADVLDLIDDEADRLSNAIFSNDPDLVDDEADAANPKPRRRKHNSRTPLHCTQQVQRIGFLGARAAKTEESLNSLVRLVVFLEGCGMTSGLDPERVRLMRRDLEQLDRYATGLNERLTFLLDAALGLISAEQNQSLRIMTVFSMLFLPPTLIASVFGMNFKYMPELNELWGYPAALGAMGLCVVAMCIIAWRRGWF